MELKEEGAKIPLLKLLRWYLSFYRDDKLRIGTGAILAVLQSVALVPIPLFFRRIIDVNIPAEDISGVVLSGIIAGGLYLAHSTLTFGSLSMTLLATKRVTETLRARLCIQLQQMGLRFHDLEKASELHSRVVLDTERIDVMGNAVTVHLASAVILFVTSSFVLAYINLTLFLVVCAMLPIYFLTHFSMKGRMRKVHRDFRDEMETMNAQINDLLQSIRLVKTFAREDHEQRRAESRFHTVTRSALAMTIFNAFFQSMMTFLTNLTRLMIYVVGGYFIIRGSMTIGDLVAFTTMIIFLIVPINTVVNNMNVIYSGLSSLGPVYALLHFNDPLEVNEGKPDVEQLKGSVEFREVSLVYESNGRHALRDVSFNVEPGQTIALVGESGAGKSTIANMILGFYFPSEGEVLIDGQSIQTIDLRSLREKIGVVTQENVLLNTTIRENIMYGRMTATEEELREATRQANALEFIEEMPEGFEAIVGDRGVRLSGGQRQRLAISRAILKDPEILILDEATSALDSESEAKIQEALEHLQVNRTCFIIAHRLSTVVSADRILVLRDGLLVESGTHAELVKKGGEYARLCERQFGSLEVE